MSDTHAPRPTDLVALVTFDDEVRENLAVTRERLGQPDDSPRPLSAAIEQWLHLGRQTWITVRGRQVQGIATAREMSRSTWQIDTLIDATECADSPPADAAAGSGPGDVLHDLLRQAGLAAAHAGVTIVLMRTAPDSPAVEPALRVGFRRALHERLWTGPSLTLPNHTAAAPHIEVREVDSGDAFALFQLYNRAMPLEARRELAMTLAEWESTRERRWCSRGEELVALHDGRIVGGLRLARPDGAAQFDLTLEPGAEAAGAALLRAAEPRLQEASALFALTPAGASAAESTLAACGLAPGDDYVLLSRRVAQPVREPAPARAGIAIRTSG